MQTSYECPVNENGPILTCQVYEVQFAREFTSAHFGLHVIPYFVEHLDHGPVHSDG